MNNIWQNAHKKFKENIANMPPPQEIVIPQDNENHDNDEQDDDLIDID